MSDPDDWAPLSPEELAQHPGEARPREFGAGRAEFVLAVPAADDEPEEPPPVPLAVPRTVARSVDPAAEAALQELKRKIAQAPPAQSLVAAVQRREQREARRQQAIERSAPPPAPAPATVPPRPAEPVAAIAMTHADVDPRETEPWFHDLPPGEQERLRAVWWQQRHQFDDSGLRRQRRYARAASHGALVFLALGVLQSLLAGGFGLVPAMTLGGAVAAFVAEALGGGRFLYGCAGGLAWVACMGVAVFTQPFLMSSLLMASFGMGAVGMEGEMRRSGGFRD